MKSLLTAIFAGSLLAASPAWADPWKDESGHGRHGNKHAEKQWKKEQKHWAKHYRKMHRHDNDHVVVHQYVQAGPAVVHQHVVQRHVVREQVFVAAPPPPGIHVVMPSLYVPF
jgi:hypothetical protein